MVDFVSCGLYFVCILIINGKLMKRARREAIKEGDMYYRTEKPCKHGHYSKRITYDGSCYECRMKNQRKQRKQITAANKNEVV